MMSIRVSRLGILLSLLIGVGFGSVVEAQLRTRTTTKTKKTYVLVEEYEEVIEEIEEKIERKLTAVLHVQNVSDEPLMDDQLPRFREQLQRQLTRAGVAVITPEDVLFGVKKFNRRNADNFRAKVASDVLDEDDVDQLLLNDASALAIGQLLDADMVIIGTIDAFDKEEERMGNLAKDTYYLDTGVKVLDAVKGASRWSGESFQEKAVNPKRVRNAKRTLSELVNNSSPELAGHIGEGLADLAAELEELEGKGTGTIGVYATCADLQFPDIRKLNGQWQIADSTVELAPTFTVEINGVVLGTGPGVIENVPQGPQTVRIRSEGFADLVRRVVVREGLTLEFSLAMDDEGRDKWMEQVAFFSGLRRAERMSEAQAEVASGYAQFLRQSGFRWNIEYDHKADIRVDIEERARQGVVTPPEVIDEVQKAEAKEQAEESPVTDVVPGVDDLADLPPLDQANLPSLLSF